MITGNYLDRFTESGTSDIDQNEIMGPGPHIMSDSHLNLGLYTNSKCDYRKLS